jgi:hypothetical protein
VITYLVDENNPPPLWSGVAYWERSNDPFHADAFKGLEVNGKNTLIVTTDKDAKLSEGKRKSGWMAIEWTENPVGFVGDGTEVTETTKTQYVIHELGPNAWKIAEPQAVDFVTARWYPRYFYYLEGHVYDFDTLRRVAHDKDTAYIVMDNEVYAKLREDLEKVLILEPNSTQETPKFAGKPLFVEPPADVRGNSRGMELPGKFAAGRIRKTRRPNVGSLSEFLNEEGKDAR